MFSQIGKRYNPEYDVRPDGPPVTWAEYDLYEAILALKRRVEVLEAENKLLKQSNKDAITLASGESLI